MIVILRIFTKVILFWFLFFSSSEAANFLVVTDIHFDPFQSCTTSPCTLITRLNQSPASKWHEILMSVNSLAIKNYQDTNNHLFLESLSEIKKQAKFHQVQFVLVLGDMLGHQYRFLFKRYSGDLTRNAYRQFVYNTMAYLASALKNAIPNVPIYFVVGNNDSYKGNYIVSFDDNFFSDLEKIWGTFNSNSHAGYYAKDLNFIPSQNNNKAKLRLIALNTVLFSYRVKGKGADEAAMQELNWLQNELENAKRNNQKVILAMHIPAGIDFYPTLTFYVRLYKLWKPQYISIFENDTKNYRQSIVGIFSGHLHLNFFQINLNDQIEIPIAGTASISPIFGNNPSFNIYTYDEVEQKISMRYSFNYYVNQANFMQNLEHLKHLYQPSCNECNTAISKRFMDSVYQYLHIRNNFSDDPKSFLKWGVKQCVLFDLNEKAYQSCDS